MSPDWLLIYKIDDQLKLLRLARIGSHSELFQ
ncbi:type II toxin-antitoxin system mRNA interferase toxin, RelE/StbE family [Legionella sp. CNM-1927-20]